VVYHTEEQIEALVASLNKRGLRESELKQALELDKANVVEYVGKCPLHLLNPAAAPVSILGDWGSIMPSHAD
jgi:bromodomain adjacent to zinc finger domain protein 1A